MLTPCEIFRVLTHTDSIVSVPCGVASGQGQKSAALVTIGQEGVRG